MNSRFRVDRISPVSGRIYRWGWLRPVWVSIFLVVFNPVFPLAAKNSTPTDIKQNPAFDGKAALALSQAAIGQTLNNHSFVSTDGRTVHLDQFRGKPLLISLVYSSCYHTCPMTTRYLADAVGKARQALGEDSFNVLTIGFDVPNDNPQTMADFARRQDVKQAQWYFLSGDRATTGALIENLGFTYQPSPKGFDHLVQTTVIDADGEIYVQVYGELFSTPLLVEPLKQLVLGTRPEDGFVTNFVKGVRLFCTTYDPANDAYRFDLSYFIGLVIGGSIILGTAGYLVVDRYRARRS